MINHEIINLNEVQITDHEEELRHCNVNAIFYEEQNISNIISIEKFSKLKTLLFVTAYVIRFIDNLKQKINRQKTQEGYLTVDELNNARNIWLKINQNELLKDKNYFLELKNKLRLFQDHNNIYRCHGRIDNVNNLPYETRNPILLSRKHYLSKLVVQETHEQLKHSGERQTITEIRSNYWITKIRSFVKSIISKCAVCKRYNSRPYSYPRSSNLPSVRLYDNVPFTACGVDYIGPMYTKYVYNNFDEEECYKCYIIIYTCASSRGVIIDLVPDASAKTFVNSLIKFISRRGCPKVILSDNGTVFIAETTQSFALTRNIQWRFSLQEAPWFGGFWERLVSPIKRSIKKTLGNKTILYHEFDVLLHEIEFILNNRPLTFIYDDDFEEILTPNHLIFGRKLLYSNDTLENKLGVSIDVNRINHLNKVLHHFWLRWRHEYVTSLREYEKRYKKSNNIIPNINDIVIVYDDKLPRNRWNLGRITRLLPSKDGEIRGVDIIVGKTKNTISRPINKVYPVEFAVNKDMKFNEHLPEEVDNERIKGSNCRNDTNKIVNENNCQENENVNVYGRKRRNAAVIADIRRQLIND